MSEWMVALAMGLLVAWALWTVWGGGAFKRWMQERSLRAAQQFQQEQAVVEPPEVHRAHARPGEHPRPMASNHPHDAPHRSGQRHH